MTRTTISTPQPLRTDPTTSIFSRETEVWDDYANAFFTDSHTPNINLATGTYLGASGSTSLCYLEIPCPVPTRLYCHAQAQLGSPAGNCDVTFIVTILSPYTTFPSFSPPQNRQPYTATVVFPIYCMTWVDVPAGVAQIITAIAVGAGSPDIALYSDMLLVRRGRKP